MKAMRYDKYVKTSRDLYDKFGDYSRYRILELVAEQIYAKKLEGSVAEVGVYLGDLAFIINSCFPDRKLFLYDTFEGFHEADVSYDLEHSCSPKWFFTHNDNFKPPESVTDPIALVRSKMRFPEQCIFRKGYFPETASAEEEEKFVFVSLDADLYKPTRAGLEFFYPRLSEGGYMFLHDYNRDGLLGVKQAVQDVEEILGPIKKCPISDRGGTLIVMK
jgi:O-methyltransferase